MTNIRKVSFSFLFLFVVAVMLVLGLTDGDTVWASPIANYILIGIMIFILIWPVLIILSATIGIVLGIILSPLLIFENVRLCAYYTIFEDSSNGASGETIRRLPEYQYRKYPETPNTKQSWFQKPVKLERLELESDASCSICLCDYEHNDILRQLSCGHHFHKKCLDEWLRLNAKCPLCVQELH